MTDGTEVRKKPVLAITIGDPSGIGPEVVLRALKDRRVREAARIEVIGGARLLQKVNEALNLRAPKLAPVARLERPQPAEGPYLCQGLPDPVGLALRGTPSRAGGAASATYIMEAVAGAVSGIFDAIVTAPISKEALGLADFAWAGHTEMLAELTGSRKPVMLMAGAGLRAALVTTHVAIQDLPQKITRQSVLSTIRVVHRDFRKHFGILTPRIAVCGLNPHAGEAGRFGMEEKKAIVPAIRQARKEGIACAGPIPADVAYTPHNRERFDVVVAMFHDQATIPVKTLAFNSGVNITLGLPIIRTSPDHGTAYDIVNEGIADPGSMVAAILMAAEMAAKRGVVRG